MSAGLDRRTKPVPLNRTPIDTEKLPLTQVPISNLALFLVALMVALIVLWRLSGRKTDSKRKKDKIKNPVIVDGSNVMHWDSGEPRIETVQKVVKTLKAQGYQPGVMFDANAGYLLSGKYQHDHSFSRLLGLPEDRVMVVPKGTPADPAILMAARDMGAWIVTNDRFRDWSDQYPEVRQKGYLVRGTCTSGQVNLHVPESTTAERL